MQITINVNDIKIIKWTVDTELQCVIVDFQMMRDDGIPYERMEATFWVNIPAENQYNRLWFQLPPEYTATLTDITIDARAALMYLVQ